ncbi:hypothetical protein [Methylobacterium adhaesivum]|uniref:HEPN domain-containing protein n=1 Tax=Methylobacterium adhaesivum TaxID=333297 RepID=A0ABT8BMF7_9HYPH|nr:hypothetical protein [Methylobacterium adhaesivum]MDN3592491.1 hypothetical protein [Methylobacterium adhaesivum]
MIDMPLFRENALFRAGRNQHMNACVGDNGGPYDLYDYSHGFLEAAKVIIDRSAKFDAVVDTLVYPACFNFRHGIELFAKYAIATINKITNENLTYRQNHSILDNWLILEEKITPYARRLNADDMIFIRKLIECFHEVDPNGQIFRYPENIKGQQHLKEWSIINLEIVGGALAQITRIFKELHFELEGALEASWERD